MFNLIVSSRLNERDGMIGADRVFEHTDKRIRERYKPAADLDTASLMALPTLFMNEGKGSEIARIGWLSRVQPYGQDYQFHYMADPDIRPLTNAEVYELRTTLTIDDWEFSRNHWAVKEVDLFYQLLRAGTAESPKPTVFQLKTKAANNNLVSLMMPFDASFEGVHEALRVAAEGSGHDCQRADSFWQNAHIMQDIVDLIHTSTVVVCDLTGRNSNVFYEVGIAHTLGKETILITQRMEDVPFDLRHLRCVTYLNNAEGRAKLTEDVKQRLLSLQQQRVGQ